MEKRRSWIAAMVEEALRLEVLSPEDLLRHLTPSVLATDLPPALVTSVLQAGLKNDQFDAALLVQTLGAEQIAEHLPLSLLWTCLDEAAQEIIAAHPAAAAADQAHDVVRPGDVHADDVPEIEVIEG